MDNNGETGGESSINTLLLARCLKYVDRFVIRVSNVGEIRDESNIVCEIYGGSFSNIVRCYLSVKTTFKTFEVIARWH